MTVELREINADDSNIRAALMAHTLPPEQQFAAPASRSLPAGDADPDRISVAILADGVPVGMFALDHGGYFREFDTSPSSILLRAFYIAPEHQGRGYAVAAVRLVGSFVRQRFPDIKRVVLTANKRNPASIAVYLKGGFRVIGDDYLGGDLGPQHVMVLDL